MLRAVVRFAAPPFAIALLAACTLAVPLDQYSAGGAPADQGLCPRDEKACDGVCRSTFDAQYGCGAEGCSPCAFTNALSDGCDAAGKCRMGACAVGFADCNQRSDDGCETKLDSDDQHCGACGVTCSGALSNASGKCVAGKCAIASCSGSFKDCNAAVADGCEVDTQSDPAHCGACDAACPNVGNTTLTCESGACKVQGCMPGFLDCDLVDTNGCECGYPGAKVSCGDGDAGATGCVFGGCNGTTADCNANLAQDGCEIDTATDPKNCGACGFDCEGGACVAGRCQPKQIIDKQGNPGQLVLDLDYAYWSNYGAGGTNGSIYRVRKDGVNPTLIAGGSDTSQNNAWGIATDDTTSRVFWTTFNGASHIGSALKIGGGTTTLASTTGRLRGAALDGNYLYYANYEQNTIVRYDVTATPPVAEVVAQAPNVSRPNTIVFDAASVYWTNEGNVGPNSGTSPTSVASTGTIVSLTKASIGTATPVFKTIVTGQDKPRGLAVDDTNVYWTAVSSGLVARIAKDGSEAARTVIATGLNTPRELALCTGASCASDPYVYIATFGGGTIVRAAKNAAAGAPVVILATGQKNPLGIASDAKYVFWVNYGTAAADGTVMKLVKQP